MAGVQELPPRPTLPFHLLMLLGASVLMFSVVGEPSPSVLAALAGFLLWILGVAHLLLRLGGQQHPLFGVGGALAVENLKRFFFFDPRDPYMLSLSVSGHHHLLMLLGAAAVVLSAVGESSVHAGYALAGIILWILGVAALVQRLLFPAPA